MGKVLDELHLNYLMGMIEKDEGYRSVPYRDIKNNLTIGYGRNLQAKPLDIVAVVRLFNLVNDLANSTDIVQNRIKKVKKFFDELLQRDLTFFSWEMIENFRSYLPLLSQSRRVVLLNMAYNIGIKNLKDFKGMFSAIKRKDWDSSASEILDSKAARLLPDRYTRLAQIMRTDILP